MSYEDKIKMYEEHKNGIGYSKWAKKYNIGKANAEYLLYLIDKHGYDILIKRLEQENLYLKADLEYLKKLSAVVQARKSQQQKKK